MPEAAREEKELADEFVKKYKVSVRQNNRDLLYSMVTTLNDNVLYIEKRVS